jgi:succinate-acetate transporter protein
MKRIGIALSLWEVFTLFEQLNTTKAKMFFEPQRYHHIMFGNFYEFITSRSYERGSIS